MKKIFKEGELIFKQRIDGAEWTFFIAAVSNLTTEQFAENERFNDTLGDWEPDKEKQTSAFAVIVASSEQGELEEMVWHDCLRRISPHISKAGWSKGLFVKLNQELMKWEFERL